MALCPGDTTEWDDIQRKMGNFAPLEKEVPQREVEKALVEAVEQLEPLDHCNLQELTRLEDDVEEDVLARYRRERLKELKERQLAARFGEVLQLPRCNFVKEVTEGSAGGQWVAAFAAGVRSQNGYQLMRPWEIVAKRFPAVKFMKGVADEVVPDFPDASTPAVLLYKDTECHKQIIGIAELAKSLSLPLSSRSFYISLSLSLSLSLFISLSLSLSLYIYIYIYICVVLSLSLSLSLSVSPSLFLSLSLSLSLSLCLYVYRYLSLSLSRPFSLSLSLSLSLSPSGRA
ncbi:unnamed protein product [Prorocentrum cordatum]|uniref:Phosducin thioredoxin-like domain-containing protein n=1 Tax=Prorocentrum cordatum TaxID=2364126 RepID=A0ABN9XCQ5_9DINO|nr:unnamed protein product [Polarella glacialis]